MKKDKKIVGVSGIGVSEGSVLARQGWPYDDQNTHLEKENEIKIKTKLECPIVAKDCLFFKVLMPNY